MRLVLTAALAISGFQLASSLSPPPKINGWYPCSASTGNGDANAVTSSPFECAGVRMPLCHEGICESDKEIELFVRRMLGGSRGANETRKALWLLQGGPGESSAYMEFHMKILSKLLGPSVDLYTTDHRGTGRSNFLECKAAQAFAPGSPDGVDVDLQEVPNCIRDILFEIDNKTEAFSVTSAAKDMVYLTGNLYPTDVHTYVYGVSYGSYFTERIMHLAPKHVRGYILDGVVSEDNPSFATLNADRVAPAERLAKACENDKFCGAKFAKEIKASGSLQAAWFATYDAIDKASPGANKCADLLRVAYPNETPSLGLRGAIGKLASDMGKRTAIPAFFYRIGRCNDSDVAFLKGMLGIAGTKAGSSSGSQLMETVAAPTDAKPATYDQVGGSSHFLSGLIKASEMWTFPSPSWDDELEEYKKGLFPSSMAVDFSWHCFFTGTFDDPACTNLKATLPNFDFSKLSDAPRFTYKPDAYWHKFAAIPANASVLVMNGKLDFETPSELGVLEYENLKGCASQKMMVEFEYGGHGVGLTPTSLRDRTQCGYKIVASFVAQDGDTERVDKSCMAELPAIKFDDLAVLRSIVESLRSVDAFYNGDAFQTPSATASTPVAAATSLKVNGGSERPRVTAFSFALLSLLVIVFTGLPHAAL